MAEVELERDRLHLTARLRVELDEEEQAKVVAQRGVDGVVVEEVAEVERTRSRDAVKRRAPSVRRRASRPPRQGRPPRCLTSRERLGDHVRAPVRGHEHHVGVGPAAARAAPASQPPWDRARARRTRCPGASGPQRTSSGWSETRRARRARDPRDLDHPRLARDRRCVGPAPTTAIPAARQVREGVEERLGPVVERMVVGERDAVDARSRPAARPQPAGREKRTACAGSGHGAPRSEMQHSRLSMNEVGLAASATTPAPGAAPPDRREPLGHSAPEHRVAG